MNTPMSPASHAPHLLDERIHAPYKIAAVVAAGEAVGLDRDALLQGTGLKPAALADAGARTSVRQLLRVCRNALAEGAAPELAFAAGERMRVSSYGMYGYALLCSDNLREVTQLAVKYHRLATPMFAMRFHEQAGEACWCFDDYAGLDPDEPLGRFLLDFQFAIHTTLGRDLIGPQFRLTRLTLLATEPRHAALYRRHLGGAAEFGSDANRLCFDAALLDAPFTLRNPITVAMVSELCERLIDQARREAGVASRVVRLLMETPGHFPDMEEVASRLATTSRTLRRRLQQEGTSYQDTVAEVRCQLAKEYLRTTRMTTEDIADRLGFSDAANFRHAFRRWTGRSPSELRRV
jgi:AraC-like DNA-binding protein